jgi:crossover junction endodeoxyribonuclease RuvC
MRVLGIDPGTAATGFGVVQADGSRLRAVDHGVVVTPAGEAMEQRLAHIFQQVSLLIERHQPDAVALEDLYVGGNPRTVLSVGQARGAVLTACGLVGLSAAGHTPAEVKGTVCGYGRADKGQVQKMVQAILALPEPVTPDHASDALAVAICHAQVGRSRRLTSRVAG